LPLAYAINKGLCIEKYNLQIKMVNGRTRPPTRISVLAEKRPKHFKQQSSRLSPSPQTPIKSIGGSWSGSTENGSDQEL
jgi:hypothetical protein